MHSNQMSSPRRGRVAHRSGLLLAALSLSVATAWAAPTFEKPAGDFTGAVRSVGGLPGDEVTIMGRSFKPGQKVTLFKGGEALNDGETYTVDEKGAFQAKVKLPQDASPGLHQVVASASNPPAAALFDLRVSPTVPLTGQDKFDVRTQKLVQGLYQVAYSPKNDKLFVTAAVGRPPVKQSELLKLNAQTLAVEAKITPAQVKGKDDGRVYAVYGVGVDDTHGNVWVTNTRENTVAVYKQADLKLVKQFPVDAAPHGRDVVVDGKLNKAYVSTPFKSHVIVFDAKNLKVVGDIAIDSGEQGVFGTMGLELDADNHKLYTVSGLTSEVAIIDVKTDKVERVIRVPGIKSGTDVAVDAKGRRLYVVAQGTDNLVILDIESGKVLHDVAIGAGALSVGYETKSGLAYVASRGAGTVTAVDRDGKIVGNWKAGTFPNHVSVDGKGDAFVINKSRGADDAEGDRITRVTPK